MKNPDFTFVTLYFGGIGVSYAFGSIFNNGVNPRFEGTSGGMFFF